MPNRPLCLLLRCDLRLSHSLDGVYLGPVLVQVWLFATPVLYPLSAARASLPEHLYWVYRLNPMAGVVDTFRRAVVLHQAPDLGAIAVSAAVVTILVPVAYVYFKHVELTMADVI